MGVIWEKGNEKIDNTNLWVDIKQRFAKMIHL